MRLDETPYKVHQAWGKGAWCYNIVTRWEKVKAIPIKRLYYKTLVRAAEEHPHPRLEAELARRKSGK